MQGENKIGDIFKFCDCFFCHVITLVTLSKQNKPKIYNEKVNWNVSHSITKLKISMQITIHSVVMTELYIYCAITDITITIKYLKKKHSIQDNEEIGQVHMRKLS